MKISHLELVNNKRIFNGLGLKVLDLSFPEDGVYRFIGHNGCGKSTIMSCLNPLPESPDDFINREGYKKIVIIDRDNRTSYTILYEYGGNKSTCSIIRDCESGKIEMNPSKNIKSARDIIMDVFNLDNNYETLTTLSGYGKKSLAMMRPSERKAFVSYILTNVQVYNSMFKTLSKRSSIFRSMINSINGKIQYITGGNSPESIGLEIANQEKQREELNAERDKIIEKLGRCNLTGDDIKANNKRISDLSNARNDICINMKERDENRDLVKYLCERNGIDKVPSSQEEAEDLRDKATEALNVVKSYIAEKHAEKRSYEKRLADINDRINIIKISDAMHLDDISKESVEYHKKDLEQMASLESIIKAENITEEWYSACISGVVGHVVEELNTLRNEYVNNTISNFFRHDILSVIKRNENGDIEVNEREFFRQKHEIYNDIRSDIDNSSFDDYVGNLDNLDRTILSTNDSKLYFKLHAMCMKDIYSICKRVEYTLHMLGIRVENGYIVILEWNPEKVIDIINAMKEHKECTARLEAYQKSEEALKDKYRLTDELRSLEKEYNGIKENVDKIDIDLDSLDHTLAKATDAMRDMSNICIYMLKIAYSDDNIAYLEKTIHALEESIVDTSGVKSLLERRVILDKDIKALGETIYNLRHSLNLIVDYMSEMDEFKDKYDYIETLRKYCNPNTTGIQVVFASLYMNKILSMANSLLANLFDGEYVLQPFIINESEFRIPVQGNGLLVDDVSSMSSSQIAMINMCLSLAILSHSSVKYRIPKFDEIDGALDGNNRCLFPNVLMNIMQSLGSEQAFIVTHNNEFSDDYFKNIYLDELSVKR